MKVFKPILSASVGTLIFLGIPLLTWVGSQRSFIENRAHLFYGIAIVCLQIFSAWYLPDSFKKNSRSSSEKHVDLVLIQLLSLSIVVVAPLSARLELGVAGIPGFVPFLGVLCVAIGFVLMQVAEKALDRQFSVEVTIQNEHQLIKSGPFHFIRHPRYLGIFLFFTGIAVVFQSIFAILGAMLLLVVLCWRIKREEQMLHKAFGEDWIAYCKTSKRIIPFIY